MTSQLAATLVVPAQVSWPDACANCMQPAEQHTSVELKVGRTSKTYQVPSCGTCARRASRRSRITVLVGLAVLLLAGGLAALEFPFRNHFYAVTAGSLVAALVVGVAAMAVVRPARPVAPFTSGTEAVRLTAWNDTHAWFHCTNREWAARVAWQSGGQVSPAVLRPYSGVEMVGISLVATVVGIFFFAIMARAPVCLRNPTDKPLVFYVDGERSRVVAPGMHHLEELTYGSHRIGWSDPNETRARGFVDAEIQRAHAHLVNPEEAGCFWKEGVAYGLAHVRDKDLGAMPLQTFYAIDDVDYWFEPLPSSIKTKEGGGTRTAVQVYGMCAEAMKTCKKDDVRAALACDREAKDDETALKCWSACAVDTTTTTTAAVIETPVADAGPPPAEKKKKKAKKKKAAEIEPLP